MTVQEAIDSMSELSALIEIHKEALEDVASMMGHKPVDIIDPATEYVQGSMRFALLHEHFEFAELIMTQKKMVISKFGFRNLASDLVDKDVSTIINVLNWIKEREASHIPKYFENLFRAGKKELISWWKENLPDFPAKWLSRDCSLDYVKELAKKIDLNTEQVSVLLASKTPEIVAWATKKWFPGASRNIQYLYDTDTLTNLCRHEFCPSAFEKAARTEVWDYLKWCVSVFGPETVKKKVNLKSCFATSYVKSYTLQLLHTLLSLEKKDIVEVLDQLICNLNYDSLLWLWREFDLTLEDVDHLTNYGSIGQWWLRFLSAPAEVRLFLKDCDISDGNERVVACKLALETRQVQVVEWFFSLLEKDTAATTNFLSALHIDVVRSGNVQMLQLFKDTAERKTIHVFNYCLFNVIRNSDVLDWIAKNEPGLICEEFLEGRTPSDMFPCVLVWLLEHGVVTKESKLFSSFQLTRHISTNTLSGCMHSNMALKLISHLGVEDNMILEFIEARYFPDELIFEIIKTHNLPKKSIWLIKAAECNRKDLLELLLEHYKGSVKLWEVFTHHPISLEVRMTILRHHPTYPQLETAASRNGVGFCAVFRLLKNVLCVEEAEMCKNLIYWAQVYYDLDNTDPIWQELLKEEYISDCQKSFIQAIMNKDKCLSLQDLKEGLKVGTITIKPDTDLAVIMKFCEEIAVLSTMTDNKALQQREEALMAEFKSILVFQ